MGGSFSGEGLEAERLCTCPARRFIGVDDISRPPQCSSSQTAREDGIGFRYCIHRHANSLLQRTEPTMNANATRLMNATMIAAILAACVMAQPTWAAGSERKDVVTLPRVVVTGKHVEASTAVVRLPRVVVTGRRSEPAGSSLARAGDAATRPSGVTLVASR
jgi:hypothetical protein